MENQNLKIKKVGRPAYIPNKKQLKELYKKIDNKELTNEDGWKIAGCKKTIWYQLKKEYYNELEANV